jgi:hypothetical protein
MANPDRNSKAAGRASLASSGSPRDPRGSRAGAGDGAAGGWKFALVCLAFAIFSFGLVFAIGGLSSRTTQSFHGLHHSAYIVQVAKGLIPPTNPLSIAMPANFYWAWHTGLAAGMRSFGVTPFEMSLVSNALGLTGFLIALWIATGVFTRDVWLRLGFCLLPFVILNPLGLTQFIMRLGSVLLPELIHSLGSSKPDLSEHLVSIARHHEDLRVVDHNLVQLLPRFTGGEGALLSDRAGNLINKFFNFNSFPVALAAFAMGVTALAQPGLRLVPRASVLGLAGLTTALTSPFPALALGIAVSCFALARGLDLRQRSAGPGDRGARRDVIEVLVPAAAAALGVAFALPLLLPIFSAYSGEVGFYPGSGKFWFHARYMGWALAPSLVIQLAGLALLRRLDWRARGYLLTTIALSALALVVSIPVQDPNEYKFVLLSAFPTCLLLLALWRELEVWFGAAEADDGDGAAKARRVRLARHLLAACAGIGGTVALVSTSFIYAVSPWSDSHPFEYRGSRVDLAELDSEEGRRDWAGAMSWLREETPLEAFVLDTPVSKDSLIVPLIAERRIVAALPSTFTASIAHHGRLLELNREILEALDQCRLETSQLEALFSLPIAWPEHLFALVPRSSVVARPSCPSRPMPGVERVYSNPNYAIYRLLRPGP